MHRYLRVLPLLLLAACIPSASPSPPPDESGEASTIRSAPAADDGRNSAGLAADSEDATDPDGMAETRPLGDERAGSEADFGASASPSSTAATDGSGSSPDDPDGSVEGDPGDVVLDAAAIEAIRAAAASVVPEALPAIELPAAGDPGALILEAREMVDAGDLRGARQQLDALARSAGGDGAVTSGSRSGSTDEVAAGSTAAAGRGDAPAAAASDAGAAAGTPAWLQSTLEALPAAGRYVYGLALEQEGAHLAAAEAFERYGEAEPLLADVAWMAVGNARFAAAQYRQAAEAFARSRDLAGDPGSAQLAVLRLGNARLRTGETAAALSAYLDAEARAEGAEARAQAMAGQIAARLELGETAEAMATRRRLMRELPGTSLAAAAMARLKEAGETVSPEEEATVLAGQGELWQALALIETRIDQARAGGESPPSAWLFDQVRWYADLGEQARAIERADDFLAERAQDSLAPEIAWQRARALDRAGRDREAIEAYSSLAESWPAGDRVADALWQRAWLLEALDGASASAVAFDLMASRKPADARAPEARFQAGLALWRDGQTAEAEARWTSLARSEAPDDERARAAYWLGRARWDAGDPAGAREAWQLAASSSPDGFYGLRARARNQRSGEMLLAEPEGRAGNPDPAAALAAWLADLGLAGDLATARQTVANRRELQRAAAWLAIGEPRAARRDGRRALSAFSGDPAGLAALAEAASELDLPDLSISAATSALRRAPASRRAAAPAWLWRLAYPAAHREDLITAADAHGIPPTLLMALVRQESLYDAGARSSAGALGLTQVMPDTGRQVAGWLGETGFAPSDLHEPRLALRFGAAYLEAQLDRFDGREWPALAAYNGGPGNAQRWWQASGGDIDRFAEIIDFSETRRYVRLVAEHRAHYQRLYPDLD